MEDIAAPPRSSIQAIVAASDCESIRGRDCERAGEIADVRRGVEPIRRASSRSIRWGRRVFFDRFGQLPRALGAQRHGQPEADASMPIAFMANRQ